jgi:hypothetical protein
MRLPKAVVLTVILAGPAPLMAEGLHSIASPYYPSRPMTVTQPKGKTEAQGAMTPLVPSDGSRISLSNEEQKFYEKNAPVTGTGNHFLMVLQKGWAPMAETRSFWGLVLLGGMWALLFFWLVRKILKTPPRSIEKK